MLLQSIVRTFVARLRYKSIIKKSKLMQKFMRGKLERIHYTIKRNSIITIQSLGRLIICRNNYLMQLDSILLIQSVIRKFLSTQVLTNNRISIRKIKHFIKKHFLRSRLKKSILRLKLLAIKGDGISFRSLLKSYPYLKDVRNKWDSLSTILHSAVHGGSINLISMLSSTYVDILNVDIKGNNVIHYAARNPNVEVVNYILKLLNNYFQSDQCKNNSKNNIIENKSDVAEFDDEKILDNIRTAVSVHSTKDRNISIESLISNSFKSGWIDKRKGNNSWARRWGVLTETELIYYKSEDDLSVPQGTANILGCTISRIASKKECILEIKLAPDVVVKKVKFLGNISVHSSILLRFEDEQDLQGWLMPLKALVNYDNAKINFRNSNFGNNSNINGNNSSNSINSTSIKDVTTSGDSTLVTLSLNNAIYINTNIRVELVSEKNLLKQTSLHLLANNSLWQSKNENKIRNSLNFASRIITLGCPIDDPDVNGCTALHCAIDCNNFLFASFLLTRKSSIIIKCNKGLNSLDRMKINEKSKDKSNKIIVQLNLLLNNTSLMSINNKLVDNNIHSPTPVRLFNQSYLSIYFQSMTLDKYSDDMYLTITVFNKYHKKNEKTQYVQQSMFSNLSTLLNKTTPISQELVINWNYTWNMQIPLENIEEGSYILMKLNSLSNNSTIEYCSSKYVIDHDTITSSTRTQLFNKESNLNQEPCCKLEIDIDLSQPYIKKNLLDLRKNIK
jgi:hypothetical protein